jgi:NAD(P)-dependent dehydrogenase (short-subunit alcohol dehydrogenase family)
VSPDLAGRVAVVTAGGSGIGAATARRFAERGAAVVVADLSGRRAESVAADIAARGGRAQWLKMDAADPDGVQATVRRATETFGRLDVMINNAGLAEVAPLEEISLESWNRVLAVTLTSAFLGMKYCLPVMRRQGGGAIVNTASIAAFRGPPGLVAYTASKHAVVGLTRTAAVEFIRRGVRVNAVCPAPIETPMVDALESGVGGRDPRAVRQRLQATIPMRRYGKPEEVAALVAFLMSADAAYITGGIYPVDGGSTA